jgi:hypothetical protein
MNNRVWIYASGEKISSEMKSSISTELDSFLKSWNAHGLQLSASFEILHDHIIIIKADEAQFTASGCSIDKQVHFMQSLEKKTGLKFFNRMLVAYEKDNQFFIFPSAKTTELIEHNILSEDSLIYNFSISTEDELKNHFQVPLKETWLKKYIPVKK